MNYLKAFITGGAICTIGQLLLDKTKLTPARILVLFVSAGAILGGLGLYEPLVQFGGSGATIPLPGFGYSLSKGVVKEVDKNGFIGILSGGIKGTAAGITSAIVFGYLAAVLFKPKAK